MSWFKPSTAEIGARDHASASDIVACFHAEKALLGNLAFLITGDHATADQALAKACDITLHCSTPFREWLTEWVKTATITSAIQQNSQAIRICEPRHMSRRCTHAGHLWQGDEEERAATLQLILEADSQMLIDELDPLCRAVMVLRVAIRSSIQDCALRLNVCRAAILGANCHVMTWLHRCAEPRKSIGEASFSGKEVARRIEL